MHTKDNKPNEIKNGKLVIYVEVLSMEFIILFFSFYHSLHHPNLHKSGIILLYMIHYVVNSLF